MTRVFQWTAPQGGATAVLVEVPHAGTELPEAERGAVRVDATQIRRDADLHVDTLYRNVPSVGATLLSARYSRYLVDLNRAPTDFDAETVRGVRGAAPYQPRGVVWRMTTDGEPCIEGPLSAEAFEARVSSYHAPYHDALRAGVDALRARFGHAILLAAHSMPSVGRAGHRDRGARRADVVPGTRGRTTAHPAVIDLVDAHFRGAGLSVRHDDPYRGGFTTGHYGHPQAGVHAIQIELSRALYLDEETLALREAEAARLGALLDALVEKLGQLRASDLR